MKTLNKKLIAIAIAMFVGGAVFTSTANAAVVSVNPASSPFSVTFGNFTGTFTFSGATPVSIKAQAPGELGDQNYGTIGSAIGNAFGVTAQAYTGTDSLADLSGSQAKISVATPYEYLAVHTGKYELYFDFGSKGNSSTFTITSSGNGAGLSNYRAYTPVAANTPVDPGKVAATPIPGAVWLFGSGIAGLVGLSRRKTKASVLTA